MPKMGPMKMKMMPMRKPTDRGRPVMPALKREVGAAPGANLPPAWKRVAIDRSADKYKRRGK